VETERLDDLAVVLIIVCEIFKLVLGIELACVLEGFDVVDTEKDIFFRYVGHIAVSFHDFGNDLLFGMGLIHRDDVVSDLVHGMNRAAARIEHDVITV
jgi:hypothetical protein